MSVEGRPVEILINRVEPAFFQTMKIPLLRGRNLRHGEPRAVVIRDIDGLTKRAK